jgi:RNA exonuclease 1
MLKSLYDHFAVLYRKILPTNPTIASEHSLRQEQEVYDKSNKLTYRNVWRAFTGTVKYFINYIPQAVISSIASLKRRDVPQSIGDPTVGTVGDLAARIRSQKCSPIPSVDALPTSNRTFSRERTWLLGGMWSTSPKVLGGDKPSEEGGVMKCERCKQPKQVRRMEEAEECVYHWGRLLTKEGQR